jgi:hypothetical protein
MTGFPFRHALAVVVAVLGAGLAGCRTPPLAPEGPGDVAGTSAQDLSAIYDLAAPDALSSATPHARARDPNGLAFVSCFEACR